MIIYISMILWVILMRVLCSGEMKYSTLPSGGRLYKVRPAVAYITVAYIIFWVGMRTAFADTRGYIDAFQNNSLALTDIPSIFAANAKGQGWIAMEIIFKNCISSNSQVWLMALAIFMGLSIAYCYQRNSEAFFLCIFIFILNGNFTWMLNGIRQFFCVCALALALPWLIEGKTKRYILLIAALSLVHFTVWLMAPLYFILRLKPWSKPIWLAMFGVVCACYMASSVASFTEEALQSTSYAGSTVFNEGDDGVHPLRVLVAAVPACLAWVIRKRIAAENNTLLNICINASFFSALLYLFGVFTSGILMGRLPIYCEVFATMTLPAVILRFKRRTYRSILFSGCLLFYTLYYYAIVGSIYYASDITGFLPPL